MAIDALLTRARAESGLTQAEVARRAGTSRPTLSAYEHGRKSPSLDTARRVLAATGHDLDLMPHVTYSKRRVGRGRLIAVPDSLPRLPVAEALSTVTLPLHLNWSHSVRVLNLADRRQRARLYEVVLREGTARDIGTYIDGALLVDLWDELVLPRDVRAAWSPLVESVLVGNR